MPSFPAVIRCFDADRLRPEQTGLDLSQLGQTGLDRLRLDHTSLDLFRPV